MINEALAMAKYYLPKYTDIFSDTHPVQSASISGRKITVNSEGHGLSTGKTVYLLATEIENPILDISYTSGYATITFETEHDFTVDDTESGTVRLESDDPNYNGTFTILSATTNTIVIANTALNTETVKGYETRDYNGTGIYTVTVTTEDQFTVELDDDTPDLPEVSLTLSLIKGVDIMLVATPERADKIYSQSSGENKPYLFLVYGGDNVSKDPTVASDARAELMNGMEDILKVIDTFDIICFYPTEKLGGYTAVNACTGEIRKALLDTFHGCVFNRDNVDREYKTIYTGMSVYTYDTSVYSCMYSFESSYDITIRQEEACKPKTVALDKISLALNLGSSETVETEITTER